MKKTLNQLGLLILFSFFSLNAFAQPTTTDDGTEFSHCFWKWFKCLKKCCTNNNAWQLDGNTTTSSDFIGTLGADDMRFRTNDVERMKLTKTGDLILGEAAGDPQANTSTGQYNIITGVQHSADANSNSNIVSGWQHKLTRTAACVIGGQGHVASPTDRNDWVSKGVALGWKNKLHDHNEYLIGADNWAYQEYSGAFGVGQRVNARGTWAFGGAPWTTLTNTMANSLSIGWASRFTAFFDQTGLTIGTSSGASSTSSDAATARLDVESKSFSGSPSGVRFRNLPTGKGTVLAIDANGYIYDSGVQAFDGGSSGSKAENTKVKELAEEVELLKALVQQLLEERAQSDPSYGQTIGVFPNPNSGAFALSVDFIQAETEKSLEVITADGKVIHSQSIQGEKHAEVAVVLPSQTKPGAYSCRVFEGENLVGVKKLIVQ